MPMGSVYYDIGTYLQVVAQQNIRVIYKILIYDIVYILYL